MNSDLDNRIPWTLGSNKISFKNYKWVHISKLTFKAHKVIEITHDDKNKFQGAICFLRFPWKIQEFNICFTLTPKKMDFVVQSNGVKWTNVGISPIQMDIVIVSKSKWTSSYKLTNPSGVFNNFITPNGVQITNQPIHINFETI